MPRVPIDYSKIAIYKLVCNDLNVHNVYVGSTTSMVKRKNSHKSSCMNKSSKGYNQKKYKIIRLNGGWHNWSMVLIEYYPCTNKSEALARERYYTELLNSCMNTQVPTRSDAEYRVANKDRIHAQCECECGGRYIWNVKARHIRSSKHQKYINTQFDYCWEEDGTPCSETDYYASIQ